MEDLGHPGETMLVSWPGEYFAILDEVVVEGEAWMFLQAAAVI